MNTVIVEEPPAVEVDPSIFDGIDDPDDIWCHVDKPGDRYAICGMETQPPFVPDEEAPVTCPECLRILAERKAAWL